MDKIELTGRSPSYSDVQTNINSIPEVATIEASSPWQNSDVSFNYVRVDYPKLHAHSHWELLIILSGRVVHEINGQVYTLNKGDACFIRPHDCHRLFDSCFTETGSYQHLNFLIRTEFLVQYAALIDPALYSQLNDTPDILSFRVERNLLLDVVKRTIALQADSDPTQDDLRDCKLIFTKLFTAFGESYTRPTSVYPDWLLNFLVTLQDVNSFSSSLPELAKMTPYSYFRLTRVFKKYTDQSLTDYITNVKLEYAKSLLVKTDITILDISSRLELTASYFSKLFKEKVGMAPGEYRKRHHSV